MFRKEHFQTGLLIFLIVQLAYYIFLMTAYNIIPFNKYLYNTAFHYVDDTRVSRGYFNLFNALSAWDGQWYYRIADAGYTTSEEIAAHQNQIFLDRYAYAFLPLYPLGIDILNLILHNTAIAAFVFNTIVIIALFFTSYYVVSKLYSPQIALRTTFLLLLFPLSLFYRVDYAEGLFLLLLLWFGYALVQRQWWRICISLSLLCLTKINGLFLFIPLLYVLIAALRKKKLTYGKAIAIFIIPFSSFFLLFFLSFILMDAVTPWITAHAFWGPKSSILVNIGKNFYTILSFFSLPVHEYNPSKTEILAFFIGLLFLIKTKKAIKPELWWMSLSLCLVPLLIKSFTSYARYELVVFPFFIYLGMKLKGIWYYLTLGGFVILLFWFSLLFINWNWIE